MTARVGIGGIWHETNTFASTVTGLPAFGNYHLAEGEGLLAYEGVRNEIGGFLAGARTHGLEPVPTLFAAAVPSGLVEAAAYDDLKRRLLAPLTNTKVDGVLLALHGAMVVAGCEDAETDLVKAVREAVGDVPIVATLDFHANVSPALFEAADVLVGYDTYPHVDAFDRAAEAAGLLAAAVERGARPAKAFRKLPLVTAPPTQETAKSPMAEIAAAVSEAERDPAIACITASPGFAFADVERLGFSVAAYAWSGQDAADRAAEQVAALAWSRRDDFGADEAEPAAAVAAAVAADSGPVVLIDVADNIGGGAPGDGTAVLAELLQQGAQGAVIVIADPEAVAEAAAAGEGADVNLKVGGKTDHLHGPPVPVRGVVRRVTNGEYVHTGSYMTGQRVSMGRTAVVDAGGVEVVLTERAAMPFDAEQLRSQGIDPAARKIIVVKAAIAWRAAFGDLAAQAIAVRTPGVCTTDLRALPYRHAPAGLEWRP